MKLTNLINPLLIIFFAVALRLLPHPPNFAPIAAMALFGGAYLNKKYALIAPLGAMLVSDLFLGFHSTVFYIYFSFILTGLIGLYLRNHKNIKNVAGGTLLSSSLFFLITNFGVWAQGMYVRDISGLWQSYVMGIPFFGNTIIGDFVYVALFFGAYELAIKLKDQNAKVKISIQK